MTGREYINREMSWLYFNDRVLDEVKKESNPLLEKIKFLSITTSNLEEFFMVRTAVIKKQLISNPDILSLDNKTPAEILKMIREKVKSFISEQYNLYNNYLKPELAKHNIIIMDDLEENKKIIDILHGIFENEIKPILTPLSVSATHPFPTLVSGRLYLAIELEPISQASIIENTNLCFIEIPVSAKERFIRIGKENLFVPIENIIKLFMKDYFKGFNLLSLSVIRVSRDADFEIQEDSSIDLLQTIESNIKRFHHRSVIKLEYEKGTSIKIINAIKEKYRCSDDDLYEIPGSLNLKDLMEIYNKINMNTLKFAQKTAIDSYEFEKNNDIFEVISSKDILLYHPYHSYQPVIDLLNQAADDPNVLAIKQTLYRTNSDSNIIKALIRAAEKGKYVSVIDELKARFDEKRNIEFARKLEEAGAHVTYGVAGLKTHAKCILVIRKEGKTIKRYMHFGTGNYNEITSKIYSDFSLFTCDEYFGEDATSFFNLLTGFSLPETWNRLTMAPTDLRKKFLSLVNRETENAKKGLKASIIAKMNSLSDKELINALYDASMAGVKIKLIVRGVCGIVPGIKGLSENIEVYSIVGEYLEHARVFIFNNSGNEEYYIASSDWMIRNLDRRIELLIPILDEDNKKFIRKILDFQFEDNFNRWELTSSGIYRRIKQGKTIKNCFNDIYNYIQELEKSKTIGKNINFVPLEKPY